MINRTLTAASLAATCLIIFGCSGSDDETSTTPDPVQEEFTSTYQGLQVKLFDGQGCSNDACHGVAAVGGLDLRADVHFSTRRRCIHGQRAQAIELGLRGRSYLPKTPGGLKARRCEYQWTPMPSSDAPIPDNLLGAAALDLCRCTRDRHSPGTAELLGLELPA